MIVADGQQLPEGWGNAFLGDVLKVIRGVTYRKEESRKTPEIGFVPVLRATNIQGALDFDDLVYVPAKDVSEDQKLRPADIVVAASSGSLSVVGKAAQLRHEWTGSFGAFCFCLRPEPVIEPRFLGWFFHTTEYRNRVSRAAAGVNINNLRAEHIEQTPIRVPPFGEQQRIADALDELLSDLYAGIAALERVQAKLKHYRSAVLKAAVEGTLTAEWRAQHPDTEPASTLLARILVERRRRWEESQLQRYKEASSSPPKNWKSKYKEVDGPETSNLAKLPDGWCWATPAQLGDVQLGRQRAPQHHTGNFMRPYLRVANVYEDRIDLRSIYEMNFTPDEFETFQLMRGDILLNEGQSLELVGRSAIYKDELPGACFTNTLVRFRPDAGVMPEFAQTYFRACLRSHRFRKLARWTTNIAHLGADRFAGMEFPLPPLPEQEAIVEAVEDQISVIDHLEADLETKLRSAQSLRQSILRHAFTGQLVPQDPKDEPAAELLKRIAAQREERILHAQAAKKSKPKAPPKRAAKRQRKKRSND